MIIAETEKLYSCAGCRDLTPPQFLFLCCTHFLCFACLDAHRYVAHYAEAVEEERRVLKS